MNNKIKYIGDSIVYNEKNRSLLKQILYVSLFILASLFIALIIIQMLGYNILLALEALFIRPFQNFLIKDLITNVSIFGLAGIAFAVSYKAGLFNIGIAGQMMASGLAIVGLSKGLTYENSSGDILTYTGEAGIILVVLIAMITGMLVSLLAGLCKVLFRVHEVVSGIMLNWIIFFLGKFLIISGPLSNSSNPLYSITIHSDLAFFDPNLLSGFVGAIITFLLVAIISWVIFKYTVFGKKIISVGKSITASEYAGYNIKLLQLISFGTTGLISGLLACVVYTATATMAIPIPLINLLPLEGFNGIAIALISFSNPLAIIPVSLIMAMFSTASLAAPPFPSSMGNLILGLVMYGTSIFAIAYKINLLTRIREFLLRRDEISFRKDKTKNIELKDTKITFAKRWTKYTNDRKLYIRNIELNISKLRIDLFNKKINPELFKNVSNNDLIENYLIKKEKLKNKEEGI